MTTVLLDTDGVLLAYREAFNQWLVEKSFIQHNEYWPADQYYVNDYLSIGSGFSTSLVECFNESHHVSKLPPLAGAQKAVRRLREAGCILRVITSFSDHYESMKLREANLINVFGAGTFQSITSLPIGCPKTKYLAQYASEDTFYVDDLPRHIKEAYEAGIPEENVFMMRHPYNSMIAISGWDWSGIINQILGDPI